MKKIPIMKDKFFSEKDAWIDYKDSVYVIKIDKNGNAGRFQYHGVGCYQGKVVGFLHESFQTKSKWFCENWWYKLTVWSNDKSKIYFNTPKLKVNYNEFNENYWNEIYQKATELARPIDKILKAIMREVNCHTKQPYSLNFDDLEYGKHWHEAYIPLKNNKNEHFLLTWHNCD